MSEKIEKVTEGIVEEVFAIAGDIQNKLTDKDKLNAMQAYGLNEDEIALATGHAFVASEVICSLSKSRENKNKKVDDEREARDAEMAIKGFIYAYAWLHKTAPPPVVVAHFMTDEDRKKSTIETDLTGFN